MSLVIVETREPIGPYGAKEVGEGGIMPTIPAIMNAVYDATGIRRQAGKHAEMINAMINDLASGHPLKEEQLREVLGHTPLEVLGGLILGLVVAQLTFMLWK